MDTEASSTAADGRAMDPAASEAVDGARAAETEMVSDVKAAILIPAQPAQDRAAILSEAAQTKTHSSNFLVDTNMIESVPMNEQASELKDLGLSVYNQEQFEMGVMAQVDEAITRHEKERMERILQKEMKSVTEDIAKVEEEAVKLDKLLWSITNRGVTDDRLISVRKQRENKMKQLKTLKAKEKSLKRKLSDNTDDLDADDALHPGADKSLNEAVGLGGKNEPESEQQRLIRLGEMTPFGTTVHSSKSTSKLNNATPSTSKLTDFELFLQSQHNVPKSKAPHAKKSKSPEAEFKPFVVGADKNEENYFDTVRTRDKDAGSTRPRKAKYARLDRNSGSSIEGADDAGGGASVDGDDVSEEEYKPSKEEWITSSDDDCRRFGDDSSAEEMKKLVDDKTKKIPRRASVERPKIKTSRRRYKDDGSYDAYKKRCKAHQKDRLKRKHGRIMNDEEDETSGASSVEVDDYFRCPSSIWNKLYRYQKTGIRWLWELHGQQTGGIVGDEMGLGKTIQMIAFLASLKHSKVRNPGFRYIGLGPVIIVCPTTVMHQWVKEFHTWWPPFRVSVLHSTGSYRGSEANLVYTTFHDCGVLVMSYGSVLIHQEILLKYDWHYVILDEGHKIRNPDAQITLACKQLRTPHRLILSGSPMQNNLKELWSQFDFVFPGKLGTLPDFMEHFSVPITQGGYSNASDIQVQTAYKCACVLRDTISPYLLRRMKADVASNLQLPAKNEQVLFCRLTDRQRDLYKEYLNSKECHSILSGKYMVFPGLITLRKICNHPDLTAASSQQLSVLYQDLDEDDAKYGLVERSGKLIVIKSLLKLWNEQRHRVLLFTQGRQMLDILEKFVDEEGYSYLRMDGSTPIGSRQGMVDRFNQDESIFVFVLTTKVGGLGVNLVGADRVIIFDPDWNPSTDTQARERAWRIGQTRQVTIYRLLTSGTIEEKIYHRQIFKQFLTNRVLKDPKQRRFFKSNDLHELFTLTDDVTNGRYKTETSALFAGSGSNVQVKVGAGMDRAESKQSTNRFDVMKETNDESAEQLGEDDDVDEGCYDDDETSVNGCHGDDSGNRGNKSSTKARRTNACEDKVAKMRERAKQLSLMIAGRKSSSCDTSENVGGRHGNRGSSRHSNRSGDDERRQRTDSGGADRKKSRRKDERDSKRKKHKHRRKDAEMDGKAIPHLDKHVGWRPGSHQMDSEAAETNKRDDDFVLKSLFKKSGVHSAVQHDRIMEAGDADYLLVEQEAERVAKEAARALRQSRARCAAQVGVPTWTGASGEAGAPGSSLPRFGKKKTQIKNATDTVSSTDAEVSSGSTKPRLFDGSSSGFHANQPPLTIAKRPQSSNDNNSSSSILERILKRSESGLQQENDQTSSGMSQSQDTELLDEIRAFLAFQGRHDGRASTQEILDAFSAKLPPSESAKFKAMLKEICTFERRGDQGVWVLKQEYR